MVMNLEKLQKVSKNLKITLAILFWMSYNNGEPKGCYKNDTFVFTSSCCKGERGGITAPVSPILCNPGAHFYIWH